ncbi:MAG: hypothetical protein AMXMBFR13_22530 [Phycisphaerae bacterium]
MDGRIGYSPAASPLETRGEIAISIGPDGRLYFHDLDPELIDVALAVNPADVTMQRRKALCPPADGDGPAQETRR